MPADFQIDQAQGLVRSRAWGVLNRSDLTSHVARLRADPTFQPQFRQMWDFTEVTRSELTYAELTEMAKISVFSPKSRRAILAPADAIFGMARMFQMMRESHGETGIRVFRKRSEALRWLEAGVEQPVSPRGSSPP
jgi:hypothetical protein